MDPILFFSLLVLAVITGGPTLIFIQLKDQLESWKRACRLAGVEDLKVLRFSVVIGTQLYGRAGDFEVTIQTAAHTTDTNARPYTGVHVGLPDRLLSTIGLASERMVTAAGRQTPEMVIGDPAFDAAFWVTGTPALARAVFDADLRRRLCAQDGWGFTELWRGRLRTLMEPTCGVERLACAIRGLLDVGSRLANAVDVPGRLADHAFGDPLPGVRREALRALVREYPAHPRTNPALRGALADPDPEVRVTAAMALGPEGTATLIAVAMDFDMADSTAAAAVSALERRQAPAQVRALLEDALRRRRLHTARACLEQLGRGPAADTLEPLAKVMAVERSELAPAAARALGRLGSSEAEEPLLAALERDVPGLRPDAAEALGRVGTVAAVLPLKEAAEQWRGEGDFPRIARQAVAAIQARAAGAGQGQLTLAADASGRLSEPEGEAGQLSIPAGEPGRVSLPPRQG